VTTTSSRSTGPTPRRSCAFSSKPRPRPEGAPNESGGWPFSGDTLDSVNCTGGDHGPHQIASGESATTTPNTAERKPRRAPTLVDYVNIRWVDEWCKRCNICVEICPKDSLLLTHDAIIEATDCIRCGLCERYCPDLAIEVLPKRDAEGKLPVAVTATPASGNNGHSHTPQAALGPAVAGTDPHRGMTDTESAPAVDRDSQS
jgi:2-oxoglutarate ferredoxin oxidoreductase subunit delta